MRYLGYLVLIAASLALCACGGGNASVGNNVINLNGGNGGSGAGGKGGAIVTMKNYSSAAMLAPGSITMTNFSSAVHGDLKFHVGGVVNNVFTVPVVTPEFGSNQAIISAATTVATTTQTTPGSLYVLAGDPNLYLVNNSGVGVPVTGLTVNATLKLPSNTVPTVIPKGIVINGTLTNTTDGEAINLQSGTFIEVKGSVTTKPAGAGGAGGAIALSASGASGGTLINLGTIDASGTDGTGAAGGASGSVTLRAGNFLYSTGTINAKGGKNTDNTAAGGAGGTIQLLADAASASVSGTIDSSGGNGASGGAAGRITLSGGNAGAIGRVSVQGNLNAIGGTGTSGDGGNGANVSCTSFSGGILIAVGAITASGGNSTGGGGGAGGSLLLNNGIGTDTGSLHAVSPEGIKVTGNITLNGGTGGTAGGNGGAVAVASSAAGNALPGFTNVEFFGYQLISLNGGTSASSNGGDGGTILAILSSPVAIVGVDLPAGGVYDEVAITAFGGDNKTNAAPGGNGGNVQFVTPQTGNTVDPLRTLVNDGGAITISGGAGSIGGAGGTARLSGYGNVTCGSGGITANGGTGTIQGGAGSSSIVLSSSLSVLNGGVSAIGGNGAQGGNGGNVTITSGNQTNTGGIGASGGSSTSGANGGNGGTIILSSEYALTVRLGLSVSRGSGGSTNTATNGTIVVDGVIMPTALPLSGVI